MPFFAPAGARMPPFPILLADTLQPPSTVARHLGVSLRTMQRYVAQEQAPRPVMLALWVESRWARATVETQVINEAAHYFALSRMLERENATLTAQIRALEAERAVGEGLPANSPFYRPGAS